jgi:hypothetical protein
MVVCLLVFVVLPVLGAVKISPNDTIIQGIIIERYELKKWQVEDDWTVPEGYSRFKVLVEAPAHLRGRTVTVFYNKWNVPKQILPRKTGIRCAFALAQGYSEVREVLWPMIRAFWIVPPSLPRPRLPPGRPAFSR